MTNNMLDNRENLNLTLECLRAAAGGGSYELMDEAGLVDQIKVQIDSLPFRPSGKNKHEIFTKIAAAALIMAMRLDHVDKVYE